MSAEKLQNLFNNKNNSSLGTANESGNGFGLALCKQFIEMNNGYLKVESELNSGSTFTVGLLKSEK